MPNTISEAANRYEKYSTVIVHRSQLKNAAYNPRVISEKARNKLKEKIRSSGLVAPPTWNKRTGHLVGGHQRVSILDTLHGTDDYSVTVAMVDVDENEERQLNIFLNNEEAQGEWDFEKLYSLFSQDHVDPEAAGFDNASIEEMFGVRASVEVLDAEQLQKIADRIRESQAIFDNLMSYKTTGDADLDNPRFYAITVFRSPDEMREFLDKVGVETDGMYVDGNTLRKHVLDKDPEAFTEYEAGNFIAKANEYFFKTLAVRRIFTDDQARAFFEETIGQIRNRLFQDIEERLPSIPEPDDAEKADEEPKTDAMAKEGEEKKEKGTRRKARR